MAYGWPLSSDCHFQGHESPFEQVYVSWRMLCYQNSVHRREASCFKTQPTASNRLWKQELLAGCPGLGRRYRMSTTVTADHVRSKFEVRVYERRRMETARE